MKSVKLFSVCFAVLLLPIVCGAQWVAYNDHVAGSIGTQTATNVTTNDMRQAGGPYPLKNIINGTTIPNVIMTVTTAGGTPYNTGTGGSPNPGTPLYNTFNGYCYFGANLIQITAAETNTIIFLGLDPNKRYKFQAGVVRGNAGYTDRWTKCNIIGADWLTPNHQQGTDSPYGIITAVNEPSRMTGYEVAIHSGCNLAGDMVEWDDIEPSADGSFRVTVTQWFYAGTVSSHGTNLAAFSPNSSFYGYGLDAFRLEEYYSTGPIAITVQPTNQIVVWGDDFNLDIRVTGEPPYYYQWFKKIIPGPDIALDGGIDQTYTVMNVGESDVGLYYAVVSNNYSQVTSSVAMISIVGGMPIAITNQPVSQKLLPGQRATLMVGVSGTAPQYQWFKDGNALASATNAVFTIPSFSSNDVGGYTVRITNTYPSSATSQIASLTVNTNPQVLFVARTNLNAADVAISNRLVSLGCIVIVQDDRTSASTNAIGKALIAISSSVDPTLIGGKFTLSAVPLVCWEPGSYANLYMVSNSAFQVTYTSQQGIAIWDPSLPLAGGLSGTNTVFSAPQTLSYGSPIGNAVVAAVSTDGTNQAVIFGYEKGAFLSQFQWPAPARRVGFFLNDNGATNLTAAGFALFDAAVNWAMGTPVATNTPIGISKEPVSISVIEGSTGAFSVNVTGAPPYYLQWRCNGTNLPGATARILNLGPATQADNGAQFTLYATNKVPTAVTSVVATLTVLPPLPITITSQPASQSYLAGGTATFTVAYTGTSVLLQWYKDGSVIAAATNSSYTIVNTALTDAGNYYVVLTNRTSGAVTSQTAILYILPPAQPILTMSNIWRYNTNGVDLSTTNWAALSYDDSTWPQGTNALFCPANELLLGGMTIKTVLPLTLPNSSNLITTIYFRSHINFTNDPVGVSIVFSNLVDDGAVYYLNGQEIHRFNMPNTAINYSTYASASREANAGWDTFSISPYLLLPGDNLLAVEVHQNNNTSSDIGFGNLVSLVFLPPTPLTITNQPQSLAVYETRPASFSVGIDGLAGRYQWYHDGVPIPGATKDTLTLASIAPADAGNYFLTASNAYTFVVSSNAHLTVLIDTNPPTLVLADGSISVTNIMLTLSEAVLETSATNIANYFLTNVAGGTVPVTKVAFVDSTHILLTTAARQPGANYVLVASGLADISPRHNVMPPSLVPVSTVEHLVTAYSYYDFYNPVPPWDDPCIGNTWMTPESVPPDSWGNNLAEPGAFWLGSDSLPVELGKELSLSSATASYFRTWFDWRGSIPGARLFLRQVVDAGAVFYLNGQEVLRFNMPTGAVNCSTLAISNVASPAWVTNELPIELLHPGANLLAVELHGSKSYETTLALAAVLDAMVTSLPAGQVVITRQPASQTVSENASVTFDFMAAGPDHFQWFQAGNGDAAPMAIPGATNSSYTIPSVPLSLNGNSFFVMASNESSSAVSAAAVLAVLPDLTPPELLAANATSSNEITLAFSKPLNPPSAINLSHYLLTNSLGATGVLYSARLDNGTNVLLNWLGAAGGDLFLIITGVEDTAQSRNTISATGALVGMQLRFPFDTVWKYNDMGVDLGTNWRSWSYNDSSWPAGPALLYYEDASLPAPKNTLLRLTNFGGAPVITYYFRTEFVSPLGPSNAVCIFTHLVDDGVVLYLNGAEIYRWNMPVGSVTSTTLAPLAVEATLQGPFSLSLTNFYPGKNVFAAEVHQSSIASADVVFGADLAIFVPSVVFAPLPEVLPPQIQISGSGPNRVLWWSGPGFTLERAESLGASSLATQWNPVGSFSGQTNFYTLPLTNGAGFYRLRL